MMAPAMPVVMQKGKVFHRPVRARGESRVRVPEVLLHAADGPDTKTSFTDGFFQVAAAQNPKPTTVGLVAADAEFSNNACEGARENAKKYGFNVVYDKTYPPSTTDFTPIVRGDSGGESGYRRRSARIRSNSVGMIKAVNEVGYKPKMIGGAMVGLQATVFKNQLGPLLNGIVNYETWVPDKKMQTFPALIDFFKTYQSRAGAEGVDPLGYYLGSWGYADLQVLGEAGLRQPKSLERRQAR